MDLPRYRFRMDKSSIAGCEVYPEMSVENIVSTTIVFGMYQLISQ